MIKWKKSLLYVIAFAIMAGVLISTPMNLLASSSEQTTTEEESTYAEWNSETAYAAEDMVTYNGTIYQAKWWTSGDTPTTSDVWEEVSETDPTDSSNPKDSGESTDSTEPTDPSDDPSDPITDQFKVVGYYPSWDPTKIDTIQYNNLTHINYAFAIPTSDGALLPLENADTAVQIIEEAHENGVKVLLSIGGWAHNGVTLESAFMSATATTEKTQQFGDAIVAMVEQYGFDGVDMDWEHPRVDGTSKDQYTELMTYLSSQLKERDMLLTSAVLSGVTPQGESYWDA